MAKRGQSAKLWRMLRGDNNVMLYGKSPWNKNVKLPAFVWPGGYTIEYITAQGSVLCAECATDALKDRDETDKPIDCDTYDEGPVVHCDNCNHRLTSSYGDPDLSDDENDAENDASCPCHNCNPR